MVTTPESAHSDFEDHLYMSRAVCVNNGIEPTKPFLYALAAGSVHSDHFDDADELIKSVTHGYLKPDSSADVRILPYTGHTGNYVIAHHLQSDYYHKDLQKHYKFRQKPFNSAADVLLEIIPALRLHELLPPAHRAEYSIFHHSSVVPLPHEDCWNECFRKLFGRGAGTLRSTYSSIGKPDFVCLHDGCDIVIESVIAGKSIAEVQKRVDKFSSSSKKSAYQAVAKEGITNLRGLVVIGTQVEKIENYMKQVKLCPFGSNKDLEIMGLCPLSGYRSMLFIRLTADNECQNHTIKCDLVPQRLVDDKLVVGHTFGKTSCCYHHHVSPPPPP